jgi:hypothetical protein
VGPFFLPYKIGYLYMMKKKISICSTLLLLSLFGKAQVSDSIKVLFLGNSYTYVNMLPTMVAECATSDEKEVTQSSNTPGGYTFQGHLSNATSQDLIQQGDWDFVVLQEQSQIPSFPLDQVETECFPYAAQLNDTILHYNPCAETVFYMTWGRQNGDSQNCAGWPPVCTYEGMDDLLNERYRIMAEDNQAILSPVGAVWRYLRTNNPEINLYNADGSHPSIEGTYAAAISFYTVLFREDPTALTYNSTVDPATAAIIRAATKAVVFDDLLEEWHVGEYDEINALCNETSSVSEKTSNTFDFSANVTSMEIRLQSSSINNASSVSLLNSQGQIVWNKENTTLPLSISRTNLSCGVYIIRVNIGNATINKKIIVH